MAEEIKIVLEVEGANKVTTALDNTSEALKNTADEAKKAGDSIKNNLKPATAQAGATLTNFNRVVSDAPFGFIGIQNNLMPLIESFQNLQNTTKESGGVFKSLISSLSGPVGIGVAFSIVSSAITFAQVGLSRWVKSSDESDKSVKNLDNSLIFLSSTLNKTKADFDNFIDIADKAQKLGEIQIKTVFNKKEDQDALIRQSKFITISEELIKVQEQRVLANKNLQNVTRGLFNTEEEYQKAKRDALVIYDQLSKKEFDLIDLRQQQAAENRLAIEEEKRAAAERLKNVDSIEKTMAALREAQKDARNVASALGTVSFDTQIKLITAAIEKLISKFNLDPKNALILKLKAEIDEIELRKKTVQFKDVWQNASDRLIKGGLTVKITPELPKTTTLPPGIKDYGDLIQTAFANIAVNVGQKFAESLGLALIGQATIGDVFSGIFEQLAGGIEAIGKQLIEFGTLAILAQQAISQILLNPYAAIAAGIALTALGSAIKGLMNKQQFAVGTRFAPGGMALVGERGPEMVSLPRGSQVIPAAQTSAMLGGKNQVEVVGVLRGQDIYFSNKKYSQSYNRQT